MPSNRSITSPPPPPVDGELILDWAQRLTTWLRANRVIPGEGVTGHQLSSGYVLTGAGDPLIGQVILHGGTLIGPSASCFLECNGASYSTSDYPLLFDAIGYEFGGSAGSFNVPPAGVFPVFAGTAPDSTVYAVGDQGGFNKHGKTENNHPDHTFDLDLNHTHAVTGGDVTVDEGTGRSVMANTSAPETGDPDTSSWGANSKYPSGGPNDADQGSVARTNNVFTITAKHGGWTAPATNSGDFADDVDNRPRFAAFKAYIRALP